MSEKLDVQHVLRELTDNYECAARYMGEGNYGLDEELVGQADEVRAAVVELIAADREYDAAKAAWCSLVGNSSNERCTAVSERLYAAEQRRAAAIAALA